jgi:hypothetical protein
MFRYGSEGWIHYDYEVVNSKARFNVELKPITLAKTYCSFKKAADDVAEEIYETYGPLVIAMSGGIDSEFVATTFLNKGIDFKPVIFMAEDLNELDVCKRPIHCTDLKREILYVKDNNAWEKEKGENVKLKKAIRGIECKNIKQIPNWVEANPTSEDTETKKHLEYKNIVLQAMGGSISEDDNKKHEKIIRNVAKEVTIDKTIK